MSARNGDKSRFHRLRKKKAAKRIHIREFRKLLPAGQVSKPAGDAPATT